MDKPTEGQLLAAAVMGLIRDGISIRFLKRHEGGFWCVLEDYKGQQVVGDGGGPTKMEALENMFVDRAYMRL